MNEQNVENNIIETKKKSKKGLIIFIFIVLGILVVGGACFGVLFFSTYDVEFDSDGGSSVDPQKVRWNHTIEEYEEPVKKDFGFAWWTLDGERFDEKTKIRKDIKLQAFWKSYEDVSDVLSLNCYLEKDGQLSENPVSGVKEGDQVVCKADFNSPNDEKIIKYKYRLDYLDGLELVEDNNDEFKSGSTYIIELDDAKDKLDDFIVVKFNVIDDTDNSILQVSIKDFKYKTDKINFYSSNVVDYKMHSVYSDAKSSLPIYEDGGFNIQCYTKSSVQDNLFVMPDTLKNGDELFCYLGFEVHAGDDVTEFSYRLKYSDGLSVVHKDPDAVINNGIFNVKLEDPTSCYDSRAEITVKVVDENVDDLFITLDNIEFDTIKGKSYSAPFDVIKYNVEE